MMPSAESRERYFAYLTHRDSRVRSPHGSVVHFAIFLFVGSLGVESERQTFLVIDVNGFSYRIDPLLTLLCVPNEKKVIAG